MSITIRRVEPTDYEALQHVYAMARFKPERNEP